LQALKDSNPTAESTVLGKLASDIEQEVFLAMKCSESSRDYREKINFLKMHLKGQRNLFISKAITEGVLTAKEFVSLEIDNFSEEYFSTLSGERESREDSKACQ